MKARGTSQMGAPSYIQQVSAAIEQAHTSLESLRGHSVSSTQERTVRLQEITRLSEHLINQTVAPSSRLFSNKTTLTPLNLQSFGEQVNELTRAVAVEVLSSKLDTKGNVSNKETLLDFYKTIGSSNPEDEADKALAGIENLKEGGGSYQIADGVHLSIDAAPRKPFAQVRFNGEADTRKNLPSGMRLVISHTPLSGARASQHLEIAKTLKTAKVAMEALSKVAKWHVITQDGGEVKSRLSLFGQSHKAAQAKRELKKSLKGLEKVRASQAKL